MGFFPISALKVPKLDQDIHDPVSWGKITRLSLIGILRGSRVSPEARRTIQEQVDRSDRIQYQRERISVQQQISDPHVGGRLKSYLAEWSHITSNPWVLQCVGGYHLEFKNRPPISQHTTLSTVVQPGPECQAVSREVSSLLKKRAIEQVTPSPGFFSPIFVILKKEGKTWRLIFNLERLNQYIQATHFKMESL